MDHITQPIPDSIVSEAQRYADADQRDYAVLYVTSDPAYPWMPWPADDVQGYQERTGEAAVVRRVVRPASSWLSVDAVADVK